MIANNHRVSVLSNDLYQFTCSYAYFQSGKHLDTATFQCFYRKNPFKGQYCILAGIKQLLGFIRDFKFTPEDIAYLKQRFPDMDSEYFKWLEGLDCSSLQIQAIAEGEIVFPKLPLLILTGPLALIQIIETPLLNLIGFSTLVATNASRMLTAANNKKCVEFGIRRAQGPDGGLTASQYSFLGGFSGTSNVLCGRMYGIPTVGTMSHAFITSFAGLEDAEEFEIGGVKIKEATLRHRKQLGFEKTHEGELAAFLMYARAFPNGFTALIDTYSSIQSGLLNTICIAHALIEAKITTFGVRLDSGDLVSQAKECKQIWNKYLKHPCTVFASNDLSEDSITEMQSKGSQIDVYAIGTNLATCQKQPALGVVYKLVEFRGRPTIKLSQEVEKTTLPGRKNVFRVWKSKETKQSFDIIALENENIEEGKETTIVDTKQFKEVEGLKFERVEKLNRLVWKDGKVVGDIPSIVQAKEYYQKRRGELDDNIFLLNKAEKYKVYLTKSFNEMFQSTLAKAKVGLQK